MGESTGDSSWRVGGLVGNIPPRVVEPLDESSTPAGRLMSDSSTPAGRMLGESSSELSQWAADSLWAVAAGQSLVVSPSTDSVHSETYTQQLPEHLRRIVQLDLIQTAVRHRFPYCPRPEQVEALGRLLFDRGDLILIAKTSFGKSTILQALSLITGKFAIVVLPLHAIGLEQRAKINSLGGRALVIKADSRSNLSENDIQQLKNGSLTYLFISPESVLPPWFRVFLREPHFQYRLGLVVIDEFHLVQQWGHEFRGDYAKLDYLRDLLPSTVPWFACTATLDGLTLIEAAKSAGFSDSVSVMQTSIDRSELRVVGVRKSTLETFLALYHVADVAEGTGCALVRLARIPKTIIFVESRLKFVKVAEALKARLYHSVCAGAVQSGCCYSCLPWKNGCSYITQAAILAEFCNAFGISIDLNDIEQVYQYGMPQDRHLAILWQRAGRAARTPDLQGAFTSIVESRLLDQPQGLVTGMQKLKDKRLERVKEAEMRSCRRSSKANREKVLNEQQLILRKPTRASSSIKRQRLCSKLL